MSSSSSSSSSSTRRRISWCCSFSTPPNSPSPFHPKKTEIPPSPSPSSHSLKIRRILSPGRVSPIDDVTNHQTPIPPPPLPKPKTPSPQVSPSPSPSSSGFDVRMNVKGRGGGGVVLEVNSGVLGKNSEVFADLIANYRRSNSVGGGGGGGDGLVRIEVPDVENLGLFRETIELMFEEDIAKRVGNMGVYRAIDVLEVMGIVLPMFLFLII